MSAGWIAPSKQRTVHARDDGACHYCGAVVPVGVGTADHIIPKTQGGVDANWNLAWSCKPCNEAKRDRFPTCTCVLCSDALDRWARGEARPRPEVPA